MLNKVNKWIQHTSYQNVEKNKKRNARNGLFLGLLFFCGLMVAIFVCVKNYYEEQGTNPFVDTSTTPATSSTPDKEVEVIFDVTRFSNISSQELIAILGEPDSILEDDDCGLSSTPIPAKYYDYKNLAEGLPSATFWIVADKVIKLVGNPGEASLPYDSKDDKNKFKTLGITDTFYLQEYKSTVSNVERYCLYLQGIDELTFGDIVKEENTFKWLKVTYDKFYESEWYLPVLDDYNYFSTTKNYVNNYLKSPSTAKFPSTTGNDWQCLGNPYYICIQSYVDAQNSFGATIREQFQYIYTRSGELVYAVQNNKVIYDYGYVKYEDLIKQRLKT
ncbi:MAG: hypothetical protein LBM93_03365 [Oscillospiraceae bacterium]|jgi:hypothetical protein|nr:hypothetical protein [Oscillospiraceae bacterium]